MASKDKVAALLYDVPGAGPGWYEVAWLHGRFHPDIPVPHELAEKYVEAQEKRVAQAEKDWDKFERDMEANGFRQNGRLPFETPGVPLKLVYITEAQAEKGLKAAQQALETETMNEPSASGGGEEG